jgi:pimeloyl-ACP methyl ester carboxylesterase
MTEGAQSELDWLAPVLAHRPETLRVRTRGAEVELLIWGERGLPGLFLLHGAGAHAHWWDGVAPLLARDHRVAAMSLPGNGGSDWRERYSSADVFADVRACVDAAGLGDAGLPVYVGHSMGGAHLMHGAIHAPEAMRALVLVDTSFRSPGARTYEPARRIFTSSEEAMRRFRLAPSGPARTPALLEHVARLALMQTVCPDGQTGWCWRADPAYWAKFEPGVEQGPYHAPLRSRVPTAHLVAEHSHVAASTSSPLGKEVVRIMLPDCGHHVMLDRPLVLVAALRTMLAVWP